MFRYTNGGHSYFIFVLLYQNKRFWRQHGQVEATEDGQFLPIIIRTPSQIFDCCGTALRNVSPVGALKVTRFGVDDAKKETFRIGTDCQADEDHLYRWDEENEKEEPEQKMYCLSWLHFFILSLLALLSLIYLPNASHQNDEVFNK